MVILRRLAEAWLAGRQAPSRPPSRSYRWVCPCGAHGQGFGANQFSIESNADQHRFRKPVGHPLPYVTDQFGNVVSEAVRNASGSVGRHWGWTN